jgi:hypothetical protein
MRGGGKVLDDREYRHLLASRLALRRFLRWSQDQAAAVGLTPAQHELLLVLRIHPDPAARPSASWPRTSRSGTTAPSSWPTGPRRWAWSAAAATTATGGWCACS